MTEQHNQPQQPPTGDEHPEVYSISQDKDGSFHFSRRDFLYASATLGGALLLRGVCPRFGTRPAPSEPAQAGILPLSRVNIHASPSIASNITDSLHPDDLVRLINDRADLGWVEIATRSGQHGWVERSFVDFSRAIRSSTPDFDLDSSPTPTSKQGALPQSFPIQLRSGDASLKEVSKANQPLSFVEVIQNGDFEAGNTSWVEESTGYIIRDDWTDPYQGSWVAWFGGTDAQEKLTQLFHVPADVQNDQTLEFYIKVVTQETGSSIYDRFYVRYLNAGGSPISQDFPIADNTTPTGWLKVPMGINGLTAYADQDIQIQFACDTDSSNDTHFVIDLVSLNLACGTIPPTATATAIPTLTPTVPTFYIYLPIVVSQRPPTPTSTPRPTATPCPSHNSCPSDCSIDYCSSDCTFECIYDCGFDCIYDCGYDW